MNREKTTATLLIVLFLASMAFIAPIVATEENGIVGLWHFDRDALDSSGFGNDGAVTGATYVDGKFGSALSLDGYDYVTIPDHASLEPSEITVEAWVSSTGSPGSCRYIVSKHYTGGYGSYGLYTGGSGGLRFYIGSTTGWFGSPDAGSGIWDGEWHYVVGTYDESSIRLYVDGSEVDSGTPCQQTIAYNEGNLYIGSYDGNWLYFTEKIDEVHIWDFALTAERIGIHAGFADLLIDIKPGPEEIRINLKSKGRLPVAVLTTNDFDASIINPLTVKLEGIPHVHWAIEDVDADDDFDMIFHFITQDLGLSPDTVTINLTGETVDGIPIAGSAEVAVMSPGK